MQDSVYLLVDGKRIENFLSYTVDADMYVADSAFRLELANPEVEIRTGLQCELYVNDNLELTGIVDRVCPSYAKKGNSLIVEGRDLMGLLTDSYCEEFITIEGMKLKTLAERLLKKVPFINRKNIVYQTNISGRLKGKKSSSIALFEDAHKFSQIEPGKTIAEVLKTYAHSRGLMFWMMPDGTFVFGRPLVSADNSFTLINRKDGNGNNIIEGKKTEDISKQYSKVKVVGQQQGTDMFSTSAINTKASKENKIWPFYDDKGELRLYKPFVTTDNNDSASPDLHARLLLEKWRVEGFNLQYKVAGHSQGANNWSINQMCSVEDEAPNFNIGGNYLIYGRTFEMNKEKGVITTLKLGYPGVIK